MSSFSSDNIAAVIAKVSKIPEKNVMNIINTKLGIICLFIY